MQEGRENAERKEGVTKFTLGQRVWFKTNLIRRITFGIPPGQSRSKRRKEWQRAAYPPPLREGIVIGVRTLSDGFTDWDEYAGHSFTPDTRKRAVLIATALNLKPVYALVEDVEPILDEGDSP